MADWKERMDREAKKAINERESELLKSQAEIKKYLEEKRIELTKLAENIGVKDIIARVKDFWGPETRTEEDFYFRFPNYQHEIFYPHKPYHNGKDSIVYPGTVFKIGQTEGLVELIFRAVNEHSFVIPGKPAHVVTYEVLTSQGGTETTYKLEHPRHVSAVPDRTDTLRSEFGITVQAHSRDESKWIYAYDYIPDTRPIPSCGLSINLLSKSTSSINSQQVEEFAYEGAKYRKERRLLPSDIRRRIKG